VSTHRHSPEIEEIGAPRAAAVTVNSGRISSDEPALHGSARLRQAPRREPGRPARRLQASRDERWHVVKRACFRKRERAWSNYVQIGYPTDQNRLVIRCLDIGEVGGKAVQEHELMLGFPRHGGADRLFREEGA